MSRHDFNSFSESSSIDYAKAFADSVDKGLVVYLNGNLGAGKTFFSRHLIQSLGFSGRVKSPTYTIVEPYEVGEMGFFILTYIDWLILKSWNISEFAIISLTIQFVIEWSDKGMPILPSADIVIEFSITDGDATCRPQQ